MADWEKRGLVDAVVTQNVDGYHQLAGSRKVYELHGSLTDIYCDICGKKYTEEVYLEQNCCSECNGKLRPGIVLFGEMLPVQAFQSATEAAAICRTMLVIGTSLQVPPANMLPVEAQNHGERVIRALMAGLIVLQVHGPVRFAVPAENSRHGRWPFRFLS